MLFCGHSVKFWINSMCAQVNAIIANASNIWNCRKCTDKNIQLIVVLCIAFSSVDLTNLMSFSQILILPEFSYENLILCCHNLRQKIFFEPSHATGNQMFWSLKGLKIKKPLTKVPMFNITVLNFLPNLIFNLFQIPVSTKITSLNQI